MRRRHVHPERRGQALRPLARRERSDRRNAWAGDFLGEGSARGATDRMGTATAVSATSVLVVPKMQMIQLLRDAPGFSDHFIGSCSQRNIRIEEDLVDQLFNSSEKRLARTLLLLARYGKEDRPQGVLPRLSQEMLAEMIGTTRSRVNFFMNKFRKLGLIKSTAA